MKQFFFAAAFLCCSLFVSAARAEEGHYKITDIKGRETPHVVAEGLGLELSDYAVRIFMEPEVFADPDGLGIEMDDSYLICVPFSYIQSGERVGENEFVLHLFPGSPVESVRGKLSPNPKQFHEPNTAARIKGKFELAGMTGDFSLAIENLSSITWVGDAPEKKADAPLEGRPAKITLKNGKTLDVSDVHRYRIYYVPKQYINVPASYDCEREPDITLVTGESELTIPFEKIREMEFLEKGVAVKLVDGSEIQFDRTSSVKWNATQAFTARSKMGSIFVRRENVQKIEFADEAPEPDSTDASSE